MAYEAGAPTIKNTMTMLAIYPPKAVLEYANEHSQDDVIQNGLHMTLVRLGQTDEEESQLVYRACQRIASLLDPITLSVEGMGYFNAPDMYVHWLLINGAGLDLWRAAFLQLLERMDLLPEQRYGYTPHMTLGYYQKGEGATPNWDDMGEMDFDRWRCDTIQFVRGTEYKKPILVGPPPKKNLPWE
jgi:2'-5' RNA ligase